MNDEFDVDIPEEPEVLPPAIAAQQGAYPWDSRLPFEMALGIYDSEELCAKFDLTHDQLTRLQDHPAFRRELQKQTREISEEGLTFRHKAKQQAEQYLVQLDEIVMDPTTPASTRLEAIKYTTKIADYEPKDKKEKEDSGGVQVNVQINI